VRAEGWYQDPFHSHEDRWFSGGRPTSLVRDAGVESHDPAPAESFDGPLVEASVRQPTSHDTPTPLEPASPQEGILDVFGMSQTGLPSDLQPRD
jgi:hypothetical protein